jgi:hypothetical protein
MLEPEEAYRRMAASSWRPFDDPTPSWYPVRWYFSKRGVLCSQAWRSIPKKYREFRRPRGVTDTPREEN